MFQIKFNVIRSVWSNYIEILFRISTVYIYIYVYELSERVARVREVGTEDRLLNIEFINSLILKIFCCARVSVFEGDNYMYVGGRNMSYQLTISRS